MDYSRKISERLWNLPDKGELESHREETYIDDIIQKSHIEKELLSHLEGFPFFMQNMVVRLHILIYHSL